MYFNQMFYLKKCACALSLSLLDKVKYKIATFDKKNDINQTIGNSSPVYTWY